DRLPSAPPRPRPAMRERRFRARPPRFLQSATIRLRILRRNQRVALYQEVAMPLVPMVVEQDGRYERSFDIYSRLLRERIVFLGQEVEDQIANVITAQLLFL